MLISPSCGRGRSTGRRFRRCQHPRRGARSHRPGRRCGAAPRTLGRGLLGRGLRQLRICRGLCDGLGRLGLGSRGHLVIVCGSRRLVGRIIRQWKVAGALAGLLVAGGRGLTRSGSRGLGRSGSLTRLGRRGQSLTRLRRRSGTLALVADDDVAVHDDGVVLAGLQGVTQAVDLLLGCHGRDRSAPRDRTGSHCSPECGSGCRATGCWDRHPRAGSTTSRPRRPPSPGRASGSHSGSAPPACWSRPAWRARPEHSAPRWRSAWARRACWSIRASWSARAQWSGLEQWSRRCWGHWEWLHHSRPRVPCWHRTSCHWQEPGPRRRTPNEWKYGWWSASIQSFLTGRELPRSPRALDLNSLIVRPTTLTAPRRRPRAHRGQLFFILAEK